FCSQQQNARDRSDASPRRNNSMIQVQGSLALAVQRMHRNDPERFVVANKNRSYGTIDGPRRMDPRRQAPDGNARSGAVAAIRQRRRVVPTSAAGVEQPAPVVVGSPTPGLETVPRPA